MATPTGITAAVDEYTLIHDVLKEKTRQGDSLTDLEIKEYKQRLKDSFDSIKKEMEAFPKGSPEREPYMEHLRTLFDIRQKLNALPQAKNLAKDSQQNIHGYIDDTVKNSVRREQVQLYYTQFKNILADALKRPNDEGVRKRAGRLADRINDLIKEYEPIVKEVTKATSKGSRMRMPNDDERALFLLKHMQERIVRVELGKPLLQNKNQAQKLPPPPRSKPNHRN